jgi:hypothetical protein
MRDKTMSDMIIEYMRQTVQDTLEKIGKEDEGKAPKSEGAAKRGKLKNSHRKTIDRRTIELLKEGPKTLEELVEILLKEFPSHDADTVRDTTKRRLSLSPKGYLHVKFGVNICKTEDVRYYIKGEN